MNSILITGCNRGLGLGLTRYLVKDKNPPKILIATCRNIKDSKELQELSSQNENIHLLEFDYSKFDSYDDFSNRVNDIVKDDGLNVLFNNAGVSAKSTRINMVKPEQMIDNFTINTVGPVMLAKALLPLLKKTAKKNADKGFGIQRAAIINMSSILGSISLNSDGGLFPYRCSKVALNMATKSLSIDLYKDGILVSCIHPGWVKTDMGGPKAPLQVDDVMPGILKCLNELNEKSTGKFYQYDGKLLEW